MPTYIRCPDQAAHTRRFDGSGKWQGPGSYDKATGAKMVLPKRWKPSAPLVFGDIPPHIGPSGRLVNSRSDQRDEFKRSGTRIYEPDPKIPRGFINESYTKKRGLKINHEAREYHAEQRQRQEKQMAAYRESMSLLANSRVA